MKTIGMRDPADYEAWYHTPRGAWVGAREFSLVMSLLRPRPGGTLLDVGCGTGWFSRRFAAAGLRVTGIDADPAAIGYARTQPADDIIFTGGTATSLPFPDHSFDHCAAITSLCFIDDPESAVREMWRTSRNGIVLGLLNRNSLLYRQKAGRGGYAGARWDTARDVRNWTRQLKPAAGMKTRYCIFLPGGHRFSRLVEHFLPPYLPVGSFLAVALFRREDRTG